MEAKMIKNHLAGIVGEDCFLEQEPMSAHTTFRIGGPARYFVMPKNIELLQKILQFCKEENLPYFILGNGSNLLVSDKGFDGVVIQLFRNFDKITVTTDGNGEKRITAQAGALLSKVAKTALEEELSGFEFAAGIPGTIGGAVIMNAGAYDGEMKQVVKTVTALDEQGEVILLSNKELEFEYRTSVLQTRRLVVLEASLSLKAGDRQKIAQRMEALRVRRNEKQPLEFPSAGSTFKRPDGYFAGKLIMDAGFCGYQVGGAKVSDKHCGFVINAGGATAADVIELTNQIREKVCKQTGVELELEVRKLGAF